LFENIELVLRDPKVLDPGDLLPAEAKFPLVQNGGERVITATVKT
jgi:hypothetical protein